MKPLKTDNWTPGTGFINQLAISSTQEWVPLNNWGKWSILAEKKESEYMLMLLSIIWQEMAMIISQSIVQDKLIGEVRIQVVDLLTGVKAMLFKTGLLQEVDQECRCLLSLTVPMISIVLDLLIPGLTALSWTMDGSSILQISIPRLIMLGQESLTISLLLSEWDFLDSE